MVMVVASLMFVFGPHWLFGSLMLAAGFGLGYLAFARRLRRYVALRYGRAVPGRIETVHATRSDSSLVPCRIYYRFDIGVRPARNVKWSIGYVISNHFVGEPVWVVYHNRHPICNDLWPPFN